MNKYIEKYIKLYKNPKELNDLIDIVSDQKTLNTIIFEACLFGYNNVVEKILRLDVTCKIDEPLVVASIFGHLTIVEALLNAGAKPDEALRWASYEGNIDVVNLLLKNIIDVKTDHYSIKWALDNGHDDVAELLRNSGVNKYDNWIIGYIGSGYRNIYLRVLKTYVLAANVIV